MATADARYSVTVHVLAAKLDADEAPMMESTVTWNGLNYAAMTMLENELVGALQNTTDWGQETAELLGQGDVLDLVKGARKKRERRKG